MSDNNPERDLVRRMPTEPEARKAFLQAAWNGPGFFMQRSLVVEIETLDGKITGLEEEFAYALDEIVDARADLWMHGFREPSREGLRFDEQILRAALTRCLSTLRSAVDGGMVREMANRLEAALKEASVLQARIAALTSPSPSRPT